MKSMRAIALALILSFSLFGCAQEEAPDEGEAAPTRVFVISNNAKYGSYENRISTVKNGEKTEGTRLAPEEVADKLTPVPYTDNLQLYIKGETTGTTTYSLYGEGFAEEYSQSEDFIAPFWPGAYILCVEVSWGKEGEYEGYQHFFKLQK